MVKEQKFVNVNGFAIAESLHRLAAWIIAETECFIYSRNHKSELRHFKALQKIYRDFHAYEKRVGKKV